MENVLLIIFIANFYLNLFNQWMDSAQSYKGIRYCQTYKSIDRSEIAVYIAHATHDIVYIAIIKFSLSIVRVAERTHVIV